MALLLASVALTLVNLGIFAWLHERGQSASIRPVMISLAAAVLSMLMFVLIQEQEDEWLRFVWLFLQVALVLGGFRILRWDRA